MSDLSLTIVSERRDKRVGGEGWRVKWGREGGSENKREKENGCGH